MAYSTGTDDNTYSSPPYHSSAKKAALRYLAGALSGLGGAALRPGANFGQSLGLGFVASRNQMDRARQAAMDYAQQQAQQEIQRQNAATQEMLAKASLTAKPDKTPVKQQDYENLVKPVDQGGLGMDPTKARQIVYGLTPDEQAKAPKEPKAEPPVAVIGPNGKPIYVRQSEAFGKTPASGAEKPEKPPTSVERAKAAVLRGASAAETNIRTQEDAFVGEGLKSQLQVKYAPNWMQTPAAQKYKQAANWWIENILRAVSGSAINPSEYGSYREIYFTQPGDTKELRDQKRDSRQVVLDAYREMAGVAAKDVPPVGAGKPDLIYNPATGELEPGR